MTVLIPGSSRRLTGPNRWTSGPAVIIDISWDSQVDESELSQYFAQWSRLVREAAEHVGWSDIELAIHREPKAAMFTFTTPIDELYVGCSLADVAMEEVHKAHSSKHQATLSEEAIAALLHEQKQDSNPSLIAMKESAEKHDIPFLWDDDDVSLGLGKFAQIWPANKLPSLDSLASLPWNSYGSIPIAFLTGTNGKTTTSRLLARLVSQSGLSVGNTSTDGLCINEEMVETGDWTGPGGARTILRNTTLDVALLETARGGMLRRGLAMDRADVALVTNVSDDHLGEWGIESVAQMADVKCLIRHSLRKGGTLLLNADCEATVESCRRWSQTTQPLPFHVGWWTLSSTPDKVKSRVPTGTMMGWMRGEQLQLSFNGKLHSIDVKELPLTLYGLAHHNISNSLAAGLAALHLGIPWESIEKGFRSFASTVTNNPGRANQFTLRGAKVLVDFGHNPDGVQQMAALAQRLNAERTLVILGQAGDRTDEAIEGLAEASMLAKPDCVLLKKMEKYLRGREAGEVQSLLEKKFLNLGQPQDTLHKTETELEAVKHAIQWAQPNDLLLLFVQASFTETVTLLEQAGATEGWT